MPQVHVTPPIIEDLRHNGTAETSACPGVQCVNAFESNSGTRSVKFHKEVAESHGGASPGEGTPARSTRLPEAASNPFFQVLECLADDPFEPALLDTHSAEKAECAYNPPPPSSDRLQQAWTDAESASNPPQGTSPPSKRAQELYVFGTPACSGLVEAFGAQDAPCFVSDTLLGSDPKHPVQDSLAVSMGIGHVEQGLDENQEMQQELREEDVPRAGKKQRYSKIKRDRYRCLVDRLVEKYRENPENFDLSQQQLPPGIAASDALKDKLLATVMTLAMSSGRGASTHQGG